jgi:hypothetical protein
MAIYQQLTDPSIHRSHAAFSLGLLAKTGVAVEKLLPAKFAKIKSRQEAPQSIFSGWVDIFYPPNFGCLK